MNHAGIGIYRRFVKRILDIICAAAAAVLLAWLYAAVAALVRIKLGTPVLFKQKRPGKNERIFTIYKFRTMTNQCDGDGKLLSDEQRLTKFGKCLRATSLDELPEIWNVLKGDMSVVGPRPQLVRDMVFMSEAQRRRHTIRPGITGLAQVKGRNAITWEKRLEYDLEYLENMSFLEDLRIIFQTFFKVLNKEGIAEEGVATATDYGDYLLARGSITKSEYEQRQKEALRLLEDRGEQAGAILFSDEV